MGGFSQAIYRGAGQNLGKNIRGIMENIRRQKEKEDFFNNLDEIARQNEERFSELNPNKVDMTGVNFNPRSGLTSVPPIPKEEVTDPTKRKKAYKEGQEDIANLYRKSLEYDTLPPEKVTGGLTALQQLLELKKPPKRTTQQLDPYKDTYTYEDGEQVAFKPGKEKTKNRNVSEYEKNPDGTDKIYTEKGQNYRKKITKDNYGQTNEQYERIVKEGEGKTTININPDLKPEKWGKFAEKITQLKNPIYIDKNGQVQQLTPEEVKRLKDDAYYSGLGTMLPGAKRWYEKTIREGYGGPEWENISDDTYLREVEEAVKNEEVTPAEGRDLLDFNSYREDIFGTLREQNIEGE